MRTIPTLIQIFKTTPRTKRGFTLIEMIVSTSIFIVAILIIVGAVISLENASRKARTIRTATDNVSAAIDSMSRNIRMGTAIHCGDTGTPITQPQNCAMTTALGGGGGAYLAFENQRGDSLNTNDQYAYRLRNGQIERSKDSGATWLGLTAREITITDLRFFVTGTEVNNNQPYVTMLVRGVMSSGTISSTEFSIQTTIGMRTPNFGL